MMPKVPSSRVLTVARGRLALSRIVTMALLIGWLVISSVTRPQGSVRLRRARKGKIRLMRLNRLLEVEAAAEVLAIAIAIEVAAMRVVAVVVETDRRGVLVVRFLRKSVVFWAVLLKVLIVLARVVESAGVEEEVGLVGELIGEGTGEE